MKKHEFYAKYANTPLKTRDVIFSTMRGYSLNRIYKEMVEHDKAIRVEESAQKDLLKVAEIILV